MIIQRALAATLTSKPLLTKWWSVREKASALKLRVAVSTRKLLEAHSNVKGGDTVDVAVSEALMGWSNDERTKVGLPAI